MWPRDRCGIYRYEITASFSDDMHTACVCCACVNSVNFVSDNISDKGSASEQIIDYILDMLEL